MNIIFLGPPGAGKGTMAEQIAEQTGVAHVSTGDIFRSNIRNQTELGKKVKQILDEGNLVPDELTIELVRDRLSEADAQAGWLLDGFPRTRPQAEALDTFAEVDVVVNMQISDEEIVRRLSGRRVHPASGRTYHVEFNPPKTADTDDATGEPLVKRPDDEESAIRQRLKVFKEQTAPVADHYETKKLVHNVDASGSIDSVLKEILKVLKEYE